MELPPWSACADAVVDLAARGGRAERQVGGDHGHVGDLRPGSRTRGVRPTSSSPSPRAKTISVADGRSETMRMRSMPIVGPPTGSTCRRALPVALAFA